MIFNWLKTPHSRTYHYSLFECIFGSIHVGYITLSATSMLLLRRKKVYELQLNIFPEYRTFEVLTDVYGSIKRDRLFKDLELIEGIPKTDIDGIKFRDSMRFGRTDILNKTTQYFRIQ